MLRPWQKWRDRRKIKDKQYHFLFADPPKGEVVCFDCETTGLNPKKAEILSIGAVRIRNHVILTSQRLELLIKPQSEINEDSIKIHQLRSCDLKDGLEVNQAIACFLHFIGARPLIGYYIEFDIAMINKYLKPLLGIHLPNHQMDVARLYYNKKDTLHSAYIDLRFDAILADLDLPRLGKHDAFNDLSRVLHASL